MDDLTNIALFTKDSKVDVDNEGGGQVQASPCKVIAAGPSTVWCLDLDNHCQVLTKITPILETNCLGKGQFALF